MSLWLNSYVFSNEIPPVSSVVKRVSPAVVLVKGERVTKTIKENMLIINHNYSIGSGFIISKNGYILTCNHIIEGADTIYVELKSQKGYNAKLVKKDKNCDIALIQIDEEKLPVAVIGNSKNVQAGDSIIVIGNPMPKQIANPLTAFSHSVTWGIIASTERIFGNNKRFFQLSLPVNFGNSGGPLLNQYGEVIGIVNFKMTGFANHHLEGVGFALSIDEAKDMFRWTQLSKKEEFPPNKEEKNIYQI